ncbi:hypothetical protein L2750_20705 [Shewanella submarina]|uniref:Uncharacterized protein n=1 Tax=Shewanella submarina TaxID=2016376 RepID=A0ABV7GCU2_9GAMM|nr:hypothetical protein [Shewanella submarina]MCL1039531.1 hypothetical protein [Shewanella submarina]
MSNHRLLKNSIESLKMIRAEMHDVMDSSKQAELDKVIADLELCGEEQTQAQLLELLGKFVKYIPAVDRILQVLSEF